MKRKVMRCCTLRTRGNVGASREGCDLRRFRGESSINRPVHERKVHPVSSTGARKTNISSRSAPPARQGTAVTTYVLAMTDRPCLAAIEKDRVAESLLRSSKPRRSRSWYVPCRFPAALACDARRSKGRESRAKSQEVDPRLAKSSRTLSRTSCTEEMPTRIFNKKAKLSFKCFHLPPFGISLT